MTKKITILVSILASALLFARADALTVSYGSSNPTSTNVSTTVEAGSATESVDVSGVPTPHSSVFVFDFDANRMEVETQTFDIPSISLGYTIARTIGPGQTEDWNLSATIRPFSVSPITGFFDSPMTPDVDGKYTLDSFGWSVGNYAVFPNIKFTVDWEIQGPTETRTGTRSIDQFNRFPYFSFSELDTSSYPSSMDLKGSDNQTALWERSVFLGNLLSETVDGLAIRWTVDRFSIELPDGQSNMGTLTPIPETSSNLLFVSAIILCAWHCRR